MLALGYQIVTDGRQEQKRLKYIKLTSTFLQTNGYKPQPLDLSIIDLNTKLENLIEQLAENTHNIWAKERLKNGWTYGTSEVCHQRSVLLSVYSNKIFLNYFLESKTKAASILIAL
jgi:ryanodine receptor 2